VPAAKASLTDTPDSRPIPDSIAQEEGEQNTKPEMVQPEKIEEKINRNIVIR